MAVSDPRESPVTIASRLDPAQLRQVGVRGFVDELLAALDGTAVPCKLQAAALAGLGLGGLFAAGRHPLASFRLEPLGFGWVLVGVGLFVLAWLAGILSRMTYAELSRLRPARWKDGLAGAVTLTTRLAAAYAVIGGLVGGLVYLLRWLPGWCLLAAEAQDNPAWALAGQVAVVLAIPAEVLLWLLLVLLLPLGALLVVEECSVVRGVWEWLGLVRRHCIRLLVVESLAITAALALCLPLLALLTLVESGTPPPALRVAARAALDVLTCLIGTLPLAYLLVANVFIYLNVRYGSARR
ncbi:MAG: hypothetical protein U0840_08865 [Gemmataceae bacterium]